MLTTFPCAPSELALVVTDWWDYHWCKTYAAHLAQMRDRLSDTARLLRRLGVSVIWAPTDTAWWYEHWPQRRAARSIPQLDIPQVREFTVEWHVPHQTCHCGPGIPCTFNLTHRSLDPLLHLDALDLIVDGARELYAICRHRGITNLCYAGAALNACLVYKDLGIAAMQSAGLACWTAGYLTMAWSTYDPPNAFTPARGSDIAKRDLEIAGVKPLDLLACCGCDADDARDWPTWITPCGHETRPHFFHNDIVVTIETTHGTEIRYDFGGQPNSACSLYTEPLRITESCDLWAAGFNAGKRASQFAYSRFERIDDG